ncbi:MAG: pyridoxine 5'-phosphate synthase [Pseudomonadota bacterium]|nr:pyridoxine 5'-phosphate synthase [Pseudomonadota bacterium]
MVQNYPRLGVNVDHIATLRNARGGAHPDPLRAALIAQSAGADGITAHLREDRRHIDDSDLARLISAIDVPLNLEMAAIPEIIAIAREIQPEAVCIVPEKRMERTTEGGLHVLENRAYLSSCVKTLCDIGIRVSLFVEPSAQQIEASKEIGAQAVELHTGRYCLPGLNSDMRAQEFLRLVDAASLADSIGLECHAGHGLCFDSVGPIAKIPQIKELNIGHFLMGEAMFLGLGAAIQKMKKLITIARDGMLETEETDHK